MVLRDRMTNTGFKNAFWPPNHDPEEFFVGFEKARKITGCLATIIKPATKAFAAHDAAMVHEGEEIIFFKND